MEDLNFIDNPDENIEIDDLEENIINNNIIINNKNNINENQWESLLNELGLYVMNYPMKFILTGILEMHISKTSSSYGRYCRNIKFKDDNISKKIENILFGEYTYPPYSHMQVYRSIARMYRHYRYNKIINIVDRKEDKKDAIGFNYENPRWNTLETEWI
jgi:hypothetical protein